MPSGRAARGSSSERRICPRCCAPTKPHTTQDCLARCSRMPSTSCHRTSPVSPSSRVSGSGRPPAPRCGRSPRSSGAREGMMTSIPSSLTLERVLHDMSVCEQTKGLSVLAHGHLVRQRYVSLTSSLAAGSLPEGDWRLPDWVETPGLLDRLLSDDVIEAYQVHHDCGKPYCLRIDDEGRRHFPAHAAV